MTKQGFMIQYAIELQVRYDWAKKADRLERFMEGVKTTLTTNNPVWNHDGAAVTAAWRSIGGKGKPSMKALRELP